MKARWLLLIHQLPPTPAYVRVKVSRRLAKLGAVALKNTVYALPHTAESVEDFQWVRREILEARGDATVLAADLVEGLTDAQVEATFRAARAVDYAALAQAAKRLTVRAGRSKSLEAAVAKLEREFAEVVALDFFHDGTRAAVVRQLEVLRRLVGTGAQPERKREHARDFVGRTWVTRTGVHVDRIASAWLIRRFIDAKATFKFVAPQGFTPRTREVRFDMFDAEFTHEGQHCTFEVLLRRFELRAPGLASIAELIHDLDLKDARYGRPEAAGLAAVINGLALRHRSDEARLLHGFELFDSLLPWLSRRAG
jgi:hypothetical protein